MADGGRIYNGARIACHETDGSGAERIYPRCPATPICKPPIFQHSSHHPGRRADRDDAARPEHRLIHENYRIRRSPPSRPTSATLGANAAPAAGGESAA
jgi:hypothetical protein